MDRTDERLQKQLAFSLEIDKEKNVLRQTHLSGHGRRENDAEHAWHMAIMAYLLREYANEKVDIARVMLMCLIHDLVEIDAGDTYAYDQEGLKTQKAREDAAKERIFSILPEDQKTELTALFDEFEEGRTAEARYAHAMDNLQPLLLNDSNGGSDWKEHGVTAAAVYGRQKGTRLGSRILYQVTDRIIRENIRKGALAEGDDAGEKKDGESLKSYRYITLREAPERKETAADWFSGKWRVPREAYLECMEAYLSGETEYGWYLCLDGERIVGGMGVIENDFHDRKDLAPNVCAVYTEEDCRGQGIAGRLLSLTVEDMRSKGIAPLYLLTDHTGFYERYGWEFLCMVQGEGEPRPSRMYIHR